MARYRAPMVRSPRPWAPPPWAAWSGQPSARLFTDRPSVPMPDLVRRPIPPDRPVVTVPRREQARPGLGQWEALIPVAASVAGQLLDGGGGTGAGPGGAAGMTQLATQRTTVTPVQATNIVLQTGGGTISTPTAGIVPPVMLPEEGVAIGAPGVPGRPAVVEEIREAGLAGLPWWVWLLGGGVLLWWIWE